jgi:hypothetical protein
MLSHSTEQRALRETAELEAVIGIVDGHLAALGSALMHQDANACEAAADELHRALVAALDRFGVAARSGGVPPALRRRLAMTGGQVAAQREAAARATAALDRAIDVLIPANGSMNAALYDADGARGRGNTSGSLKV